jgi:thiol-disulfide isomerase/thioredoxin
MSREQLAGQTLVVIGGSSGIGLETARRARQEGAIPSLNGATEWLNSPPVTPATLRGKVALIDFWTYTCVNWLRTLPYVRAWAEKYRDQGLLVVGVHTPEFPFEKDIDNVRWAATEMAVKYPIAVDSDYSIWQAFDKRARVL